jgi:molybdate transport system substrate-binding protein
VKIISRRRLVVLSALAALVPLTACGGDGSSGAGGEGGTTSTITVLAASSLTGVFTELGKQFESEHDEVTVTFAFDSSATLAQQAVGGAPADVLATADTKNMDKVTAEALTAAPPVAFASNTLEIAVPPGNPAHVASLTDLAAPGVKVVVCAPAVPCGSAATKVEQAAGVDIRPVSEEQSVTDVLGKVSAGEADAGLVYVTDVKGAGDGVQGITFPQSSAAVNSYPIAALKASRNAALADAFVRAVTGSAGQQVLAAAGFAKAP